MTTLSWPRDGIVRERAEGLDLLIFEDRPHSIAQMFYDSVEAVPERTALICDAVRWTYKELETNVNRYARVLEEKMGVYKGDRIAVLLDNRPEFVILYLAITTIGSIFIPLNTRLKSRELVYQIQKSEPKLLFVSNDFWSEVEPIQADIDCTERIFSIGGDISGLESFETHLSDAAIERLSDQTINEHDPACILFTSGTTGHPKGVVLSHRIWPYRRCKAILP